VSAQNHVRTLQELANLKSSATNEQATITKLKTQLEDFIKTKDETEKEMLQQFMQLINEKKRKIRDQSRLLAGAKVSETEGKLFPWCPRTIEFDFFIPFFFS
jgi:rubrerythrin